MPRLPAMILGLASPSVPSRAFELAGALAIVLRESWQMSHWVRVADAQNIPEGVGTEVMAGEQIIALYRIGDAFYALDGICPHAGGPLAEGELQGTVVTCPWHGWQFDVTTGQHCLNQRLCHPSFHTRVEGNDVYVEID